MNRNSCSVRELSELPQELRPEVIVAPLALDRLDDESRDLVRVVVDGFFDLPHRLVLGRDDLRRGAAAMGNRTLGLSIRGQSNFGKYIVFRGSAVLVMEME